MVFARPKNKAINTVNSNPLAAWEWRMLLSVVLKLTGAAILAEQFSNRAPSLHTLAAAYIFSPLKIGNPRYRNTFGVSQTPPAELREKTSIA